jgi:hypothetical protein
VPIPDKTLVKVMAWIALEILFNLLGLDDLADYSEFVFEHHDSIAEIRFQQQQDRSLQIALPAEQSYKMPTV